MSRIHSKTRYWPGLLVIAAIAALMTFVLPALTAGGADHLDGPTVATPGGVLGTGLTTPQGADPRVDITDVYAFQSPDDSNNTVLIMTVSPLAGVVVPTTFLSDASYDINIDNDGDNKEDITFKVAYSDPDASGVQDVTLRRIGSGGPAVVARGRTGEDIAIDGGGTLRIDVYDDPFFFDLAAFLGAYPFCELDGKDTGTGSDFFAGFRVMGIVLEVPSSSLGSNNIGVWARTELNGARIDRMAAPLVNTLDIPNEDKNAFNLGQPKNDPKNFGVAADILTIDTSNAAGFPNGRQLEDDVVGFDCVDEKAGGYPGSFPYLNQ